MLHNSKAIQSGRYDIYVNNELAATTTCPKLYHSVIKVLEKKVMQNQKHKNQMKVV